MLAVHKDLDPKDIGGRKYRSPAFGISAIISLPFLIAAIFASVSVPPREGRGVIIGLIFIVLLALPVALLWGSRKTSYILAEDKLYFFNAQVTCLPGEKRKKLRRTRTNGSVCYSDIKDLRYFGIELEGHPRKRFIVPPRVVIMGDEFEVEIYAYKSLINKIENLK